MKDISQVILRAKQKGMYTGSLKIPIIKGILRVDKVEFLISEWEDDRPNIDSIHESQSTN